jgi:Ca2+-binding EF-hand superfamily protein
MISDIDKDGSGSIDFEEFLDMMTVKMSDKDTREDINKVFNLFDDDQTGHITLRNLKVTCCTALCDIILQLLYFHDPAEHYQ